MYKLERLEYLIVVVFTCLEFRIRQIINCILYNMIVLILSKKQSRNMFNFQVRDGSDFKEEIPINEVSYEFIWYFQGFITIPSLKQVIIYIGEKNTQFFSKSIEFLQDRINSNLIIGGDFKVSQNSPLYTLENSLLSFYPGKITYLINTYLNEPDYFIEIINEDIERYSECQQNPRTDIGDFFIQKQDLSQFVWIKIKEIYSYQDEFYFQLFKLSSNFNNPKMISENLCQFQLFYKISSQGNQIIITTYSFTFPVVNIDFSNNPFLKTQIFDIACDIQLWHYILVKKTETSISISITFYQGLDQIKLNMGLEENQFNMVQFKLLSGNILQSKLNYLNVQIVGLKLLNCPERYQSYINCHPYCKECDGPTKKDCVSCFESSNRLYLSDFKECICVYGTIEQDDQCINYEALQFDLIQETPLKEECLYGFFELNYECYQCPSIINNNVITCLECVQNPKQWGQILICQTILSTDKNGNTSNYLTDQKLQYILVGNDVQYCPDCNSINPSQVDQVESIFKFKRFCQSIQNGCYSCSEFCLKCQPISTNLKCLNSQEIYFPPSFFLNEQICEPPNFVDFYKKCVTCKIKNCLYCFNYLVSDPTKTTLEFHQDQTIIDEEIKEGCAQCNEEFVFDFKIGQCILQTPSQQNCLRAYQFRRQRNLHIILNQQFQFCFRNNKLSNSSFKLFTMHHNSIKNYKMFNLEQFRTLEMVNIKVLQFNTYLIQLYFMVNYYQINKISKIFNSFFSFQYNKTKVLETQCIKGYEKIQYFCTKYCDEMCSVCEPSNISRKFFCSKCKLNYFKEPLRVQVDGKCINCPFLCQVCQERSNEEINAINPYFIITPDNIIYTFKCLQKIPSQLVQIDQNLKIAYFCYQNNCNYNLELNYGDFYCNYLDNIQFDLSKYYNYQYFNEIGLKYIILTLLLPEYYCEIYQSEYFIDNTFRDKIFSMQQTKFKIQGRSNPIYLMTDQFKLSVLKYDFIILNHLNFLIQKELVLICENRDLSVDLKIVDTQFYSNTNSPIYLSIIGESFINVNIQNVSIFNISIENSIIFNLVFTDQNDQIIIHNFQLQDCKFTNSTIFLFQNARRSIHIENFSIDSCEFYNSTTMHFNQTQNQLSNIIFTGVLIKNSLFNNLNLIYSIDKTVITISNFQILSNQIINSKFIIFNYDFFCNNIFMEGNKLISIQFISQVSVLLNSAIQMNNIQILANTVQNFSLFVTEQKQSTSQVNYLLQNFYFEDNIISCDQEQFLITINSFSLIIKNIFLRNTKNYRFIPLQAIPLIIIENIVYYNLHQEQKVQISPDCFKNCIIHSQLLQVSGFKNITLNKITIKNQFSIDYSIISIQSNPLTMLNSNEYIFIKDVKVKGNILIKQHLGIIFSLVELYSEKSQLIKIDNLQYEQNIFHQYNKDPSKTSASLLYVNSPQSFMLLTNINCFNNTLTNSAQSYFSLFLFEILIDNIKVSNHNYIDQELWIQQHEIELQEEYNQNEITQVISQSFKIEIIGGVLSTTVSKLTILNGEMEQQLQKTVLLFMHTIYQFPKFKMNNSWQEQFIINQSLKYYFNKCLKQTIIIHFFKISFICIKQHLNQKYICLRLFLTCQFKNAQQNKVNIENFMIIQNEQALMIFLQSLGSISLIEIQKVISDNAIMNFQGCELLLNGIQIEGILLFSIIKVLDSKFISLINCKFIDVLTFYPLHLMDIQNNNIQQSRIYLNNITISNLKDFTQIQKNLKSFDQNHIELEFYQCSLKSNYVVQKIRGEESLQTFFDDIITYSNQNGSLIKLKTVTNKTRVSFSKVLLLNNNCQYCQNGLLFFELNNFEQFQISELSCIKNSIKDMVVYWLNQIQELKTFQQLNILLLFLTKEDWDQEFQSKIQEQKYQIQKLQIILLLLEEVDSILKKVLQDLLLNLLQSLIIQQKKQEVFIQVEIVVQIQIILCSLYSYLILLNWLQIILMNYQVLEYQSYITEFTIKFKNSLNEQQINFLNSTCNVQQLIFDITSQKVIELITISTISFDQKTKSFNLGSLQFNMDPYNQEDQNIYEILIFCEFYISYGCQKCQSEQGFYSVTYNSTKYSLFDKNKFEAITSNKIKLKAGFWRSSYITENVELCYKNPRWIVGDDLCFNGHIGALCEECDRYNLRGDGQFFKNQQQLDCQQCDELSKRLIAFFLVSIWALLSTLITISSIEQTNQLYAQLKLRQNQKFAEILFKLEQDHESILLKLFLNYLRIFSLIFTFNINFSLSLNIVKPSNDSSYFMANFFECLVAEIQGIDLIYSRILVMFGIIVCQILIIFIGFQLISILKNQKFQSRIISITSLYLYIQNYASLINQYFSILAVRRISDLDYIQGDVSMIYGSSSHLTWIYWFVIPGSLLIGLILPLTLFLLMYINKDQHKKINFRRHIGYLFNEYTQKNYFWEIIKLWKKTIIIIILIYFETDIILKALLLDLCILIYTIIAQSFKPYILHKFNLLDIKSGQFCQIAIILAAVKHLYEQQEKQNISSIIQSFIILNSIILSYPFIMNILQIYYKKYKFQILSLLLKGFQILRPNFVITKLLKRKLIFLRQKQNKSKVNIEKLKSILFSSNSKFYLRKSSISLMNSDRGQRILLKTVESQLERII
ncbi:unnamed protein product [Paramecium sonneborni]|uniref:Transmembrane protein n=1 Tax=Paramecium sonneborni TaxID=65129 RepID=A0A8S1RPC6_9CILI|nr:unnamed protein product [Paramecium sonneborni]